MMFMFYFNGQNIPQNVINKIGNRYGNLTVISFAGTKNGKSMWVCRCDCGNYKIVSSVSLVTGNTKSCGCLPKGDKSKQVHCQCDNCGKALYLKASRFARSHYHYCSKQCFNSHKKVTFCGKNNHQYGLKGVDNPTFKQGDITKRNNHLIEKMVYVGDWYVGSSNCGRVCEHRFLVEKFHDSYDQSYFNRIGDWYYLKPGIEVHHIDFNHENNNIPNLIPLPKGEHVRLHNLHRKQHRDNRTGRFIKSN